MSDSAHTDDDAQITNAIATTVETTDDRVRITTESGTTIEGEVSGDASVTTVADETATGGFGTTIDPAEVDGEPVDFVLITSAMVFGEAAPQFAQVYHDDCIAATEVVADVEVIGDE